jgi:hypothetical protein
VNKENKEFKVRFLPSLHCSSHALIVAQRVEEIKFEYNLVNEFKFSVLW